MEEEDDRPSSSNADRDIVTSQEGDIEQKSNIEEDEEILSQDDKELNDQERIQLYDKGVRFKANHSYKHALLCFLGCIKGLQHTTVFPMLPNCLQNIASIYAKLEDFPKAVQFMQAAKMYYETAIIGTQDVKGDDGYQTMDENAIEDEAKRANEYEKLSHDCVKEKNIHLALEYCGKATQLRRKVYGENHSVTVKSLDLFTIIYAEMGKIQYTEAIEKFDKKVSFEDEATQDSPQEVSSQDSEQKEESQDLSESEDSVPAENQGSEETKVDSNPGSSFLSFKQVLLFIFLSSIFAFFTTWIWCEYTQSKICPSYDYIHQRSKFYYYYYVQSWLTDNKYL